MSRGSFNRPEVAAEYARTGLFATGDDLAWLTEAAALTGQERVLDLGTAAGHTALALAPKSALTVGLDPAPAMLRQARRLARERKIDNLELVASFADPVPFPDEVFDLVTCRLAAHHFPDLPGALYEVKRLLRPGGRLIVIDVIAPGRRCARRIYQRDRVRPRPLPRARLPPLGVGRRAAPLRDGL